MTIQEFAEKLGQLIQEAQLAGVDGADIEAELTGAAYALSDQGDETEEE